MEMKGLELKVPPVVQVILLAALMYIFYRFIPVLNYPWPGSTLLAILLAILGIVVAVAGAVTFKRHGTTLDPRTPEKASQLVTSGIYRFTRNPMYVGMFLILSAWAVYLMSLLAFIALPVFVIYMTRFQIIPEECQMRRLFGEEYEAYTTRVRRWI